MYVGFFLFLLFCHPLIRQHSSEKSAGNAALAALMPQTPKTMSAVRRANNRVELAQIFRASRNHSRRIAKATKKLFT